MTATTTATAITTSQKQKYAENFLAQFSNEMIDSFGSKWTLNTKQTIARALEKDALYLQILGNAVYEWSRNEMGMRRQEEAIERVVARLEEINSATIPPVQWMIDGMNEEMTSFDFALIKDVTLDIAKTAYENTDKVVDKGIEVVGSVAKNVTNTVENVGKSIEATGEGLLTTSKMLPLIVSGIVVAVLVLIFKVVTPDTVKSAINLRKV